MLTSYLSNQNYKSLSATYIYDKQIDYINNIIGVDGNLSINFSPVFSNTSDFSNNNYSLFYLTPPLSLSDITNFNIPYNSEINYFCTIKCNIGGYVYFTTAVDELTPVNSVVYDQLTIGSLSSINDNYFFELNLTDLFNATIKHYYSNKEFYLAFNPATFNLNFVILSAFNASNDFTRKFTYTFDEATGLVTFQTRIRGTSYTLVNNISKGILELTPTITISLDDNKKFFKIDYFKKPSAPEITNDWGSYTQTYKQNNLLLNEAKSFYNIKNNFLLHTEYNNIQVDSFTTNFLTLKNQLNNINLQGRGNIFLNEAETFYRNYNTIFTGRRQEKGHEKIHLQYDTYSTPYTFKSGKTTWFHTPYSMYPYKRLNIKSSKLVEAGAVAGDHPLKSDKVFRKLANYSDTSNQGNTHGEQTGQWLCAWLSGGNNFATKPVWVDRFYNSAKLTAFEALSADTGNVSYTTTFNCLDLPTGVIDLPSSLVFEPGSWYAYSRVGKIDIENNINSRASFLLQKNLDMYKRFDGSILDPYTEDFDTYKFDGTSYGYFDVNNFKYETNIFSILFWANSNDWTSPKGYQIAGNYNDYGLGVFNYNAATPFLFYNNGNSIVMYNADLSPVNTISTELTAFGKAQYILRRDALNTFHVITETQNLVEYDMRGAVVDYSSTLKSGQPIIFATNDEARGYILYNDMSLSAIDLTTNLMTVVSADKVIGNKNSVKEVIKLNNGQLAAVDGTGCLVRGNNLYFLSAGIICNYNTSTEKVSSYIGNRLSFSFFNIDKNNNIWTGDRNYIAVYGPHQELLLTTTLTAASSFSTKTVNIDSISFVENFYSGELDSTVLVNASGSSLTDTVVYSLDLNATPVKQALINSGGNIIANKNPSNSNFNFGYLNNRYGDKNYTFKVRLYNPYNIEDIEIPSVTVLSSDLESGYHHFAIILNTVTGVLKLYVDGEFYATTEFTPMKYALTSLLDSRIYVGATPFYNNTLLSELLDKKKDVMTSFFVNDLDVQNLYMYSYELNYSDIGMHYKQKILPDNLVWDVPSGRRNFIDTVSRTFKQKIPGAKSPFYNVYINDNVLDTNVRDLLKTAVINQLAKIMPGYSKLNKLSWATTLQSQSATYVQPFFPSNTLTNAAVRINSYE